MRSYNQFISVLKAPTTAGSITLTIESQESGDVFTDTIAVLDTDNEIETTKKLLSGLNTIFTDNEIEFSGTPVYGTDDAPDQFKAIRTDHVIAMWSQARFSVALADTGSTGLVTSIQPNPVFMTIPEFDTYASLNIGGQPIEDADGDPLGEEQTKILLEIVSDELCKVLRNNIVMTPYLHQQIANGTTSIQLKMRPVNTFDSVNCKRQGWDLQNFNQFLYPKTSFRLNPRLGTLADPHGSMLIDVNEPFAKGNEVLVSYVAGNQSIPVGVKRVLIQLAGELGDDPNLKVLKGADFSVEFFQSNATLKFIKSRLSEYFL